MSSARFWFILAAVNMVGMWTAIITSWPTQDAGLDCPVVPYPVTVTVVERIGV